MDIETILTYVAYAISIASVLVPALYKIAEITPTNKDNKIVEIIDKVLKVVIDISEAVGVNKLAEKQKTKKIEKEKTK